jgi:uncharacterized protein YegP (UPF0339 family)
VARYYFHLVSEHEVILDNEGVEVADLAAAGAEALKAIEELRRESPSAATGWEGWWLEVTDASGAVAFSINLDDPN